MIRILLAAIIGLVLSHQICAQGLHGYIGYSAGPPPKSTEFSAGMGFYSAVWPLIDQPLANFQIGLAGSWVLPNNRDNKDRALAPEGTLARKWPERGPTWSSVFQTLEGGLGYWRGNRFRYGPPKFSMNATPQCYDYEIGSPGWGFFRSHKPLPDNRLGIAQLSNRLLIPPDGLPFEGNPRGDFLGYAYMALPFTDPVKADAAQGREPTGNQSWTCFLEAKNFRGPIAYYIPETWSKIARLFKEPFLYGRGLDTRGGIMGGGAMEINTVPRLSEEAKDGTIYTRIPKLEFPVDKEGCAVLVQDVTYYSKTALFDQVETWRKGGEVCKGQFDPKGAFVAKLTTRTPKFDQGGKSIQGVDRFFDTKVFDDNTWGLVWKDQPGAKSGIFPEYFRGEGKLRIAIDASELPEGSELPQRKFQQAQPTEPYVATIAGSWAKPGPANDKVFTVTLGDGSKVSYQWYRFVDQPSFQQYKWSKEKREALQGFVSKMHRQWAIDQRFMAPPTTGKLVSLDPALIVTPPAGMEAGYVPIVIKQEKAP